jgi:hypothetical protein
MARDTAFGQDRLNVSGEIDFLTVTGNRAAETDQTKDDPEARAPGKSSMVQHLVRSTAWPRYGHGTGGGSDVPNSELAWENDPMATISTIANSECSTSKPFPPDGDPSRLCSIAGILGVWTDILPHLMLQKSTRPVNFRGEFTNEATMGMGSFPGIVVA